MADVELDLQVLRLNVIGIREDVRDLKARTDHDARYHRLQARVEVLRARVAALELRCSCQSTAPAEDIPRFTARPTARASSS